MAHCFRREQENIIPTYYLYNIFAYPSTCKFWDPRCDSYDRESPLLMTADIHVRSGAEQATERLDTNLLTVSVRKDLRQRSGAQGIPFSNLQLTC